MLGLVLARCDSGWTWPREFQAAGAGVSRRTRRGWTVWYQAGPGGWVAGSRTRPRCGGGNAGQTYSPGLFPPL